MQHDNLFGKTAVPTLGRWGRYAPRRIAVRGRGITSLLVVVLVFASGFRLILSGVAPVVDPTEGRYAQIAENMVATGDWVTPHIWFWEAHIPYLGKPPLFFWTAALSIDAFGANEFAARLPSFVAAIVLLFLMFKVLSTYLDRQTATLATLITATSALFFSLTGAVVVDMHLSLFVSGAFLAHLAFALEPDDQIKKRWSLLVFLLLAGGFLTKGPVALILFGLPVAGWTLLRNKWGLVRKHAWIFGLSVFTLIAAPWFVVSETHNPGFLRYFFINENLLRYLSPNYGDLFGSGHIYPRGSAVLMFVAAALPWSLVAFWLLAKRGLRGFKRMMDDDVASLLFLGFAVNVAFWCFARQLILSYMLPMVPAFAAWLAYAFFREASAAARSRIMNLAGGAAVLWCVLILVQMPAGSVRSTRELLDHSLTVARENGISSEIVFGVKTPQSAYFYAPGRILPHPVEDVRDTVERALQVGQPLILAIREKHADKIPEDLMPVLQPVENISGWRLYLTAP